MFCLFAPPRRKICGANCGIVAVYFSLIISTETMMLEIKSDFLVDVSILSPTHVAFISHVVLPPSSTSLVFVMLCLFVSPREKECEVRCGLAVVLFRHIVRKFVTQKRTENGIVFRDLCMSICVRKIKPVTGREFLSVSQVFDAFSRPKVGDTKGISLKLRDHF